MTHPLDPLTADEFRHAAALLRREKGVARPTWRIAGIELREPSKAAVAAHRDGDEVPRRARAVVWDTTTGVPYVAMLDLTGDSLVAWDAHPDRQPNATVDEWHDCDEAMRAHPDVVAALAARGIDDPSLALVDVWTYGAARLPQAHRGRRVGWCDVWVRDAPDSNPYAHPVAGLRLIVDLNTMELLEIVDHGDPGRPDVQGEYAPAHVPGHRARTDRKPLEITQPEGVSFSLDGHALRWQNWRLRIGFTHREGLVLHQVGWHDGTATRPIAHRLSFAEMVVPYRDPTPQHADRTAFDIGEWGLGFMTTSLELGCDCLGEIRYLDAVLHDTAGEPQEIRNAICLHEEDNGVLWKHVDGRAGAEVRRMRRMVISTHVTVANYEYLVYWRLYEDGSIECEVRATGIMVTTPFTGDAPPYGVVVDRDTYAPIHQHFIVARLDMEVDGPANTVVMTEAAQPPIGPDNPDGLALVLRNEPVTVEGPQDYRWETQRAWKVTNPSRPNAHGTPVAYKLVPGAAIPPMLDPASSVFARAQAIGHTLWVTPFDADERWPCGEFVNQSAVDEGLPVWTARQRSVEDADVVLWYVFGIHHVPRVEDWPVMPADTVSFWLKPAGFFDANPALDVAP
ncbi:primary-amine oxidase [Pseudonocardia hydrocarbonoxydans]|uniref:Amine oxidase n=1 Tax=Pseudonocardia hydrocarbonoxydans TaxID=76726 RepID=A0A4Y3WLN4_9PSEU|nr:amine oxidase [Pseudonocardia hydrocarbonoxydans]